MGQLSLRSPLLREVTLIAVTGRSGKTTTTNLVDTILAPIGRYHTVGDQIIGSDKAREALLKIPTSARCCTFEVSGHRPGAVAESADILRPQIGIGLNVGGDHYNSFRGLEATAIEKGRLVESLPQSGTATLNIDDPHVRAMASRTAARPRRLTFE